MNLQQMKYVLYTAKYNSFSKAAKELFVTQPNVSSAIKDLENELKIQIFDRNRGSVALTREGAMLVSQITPIVEQMGFIENYYANEVSVQNILSIACQHCVIASEALAKLLKEITAIDDYKIQFLEVQTKEMLSYVQEGTCELGILLKNRNNKVMAWELEQRNLEFTLVQERSPFVHINQKHPLAGKMKITKEDLAPYPYIKYYQGQNSMQFFSEEIVEDHEAAKTIIVTDNMTVANIMSMGTAYTIGSGYQGKHGVHQNGESVAVPYDSDEVIELGYITRRGARLSDLCTKYITIFEKYAKS